MKLKWTSTVLVVSAFWVFYNALFSETIPYFDSSSYEALAKGLGTGQWINCLFVQGPSREPLYPLFLSLNMKLADWLHISYTNLTMLTQGIILLLTQYGLARIFEKINLSDKVSAILISYFIVSPAILRSSLIIYSEIITYPFMLMACVVVCHTWMCFMKEEVVVREYIKRAFYVGLVFLPLMFSKAIFETIVPLFLVLFVLGLFLRWRKNRQLLKKIFLFGLIAYSVFVVPVTLYKSLNKIYNGVFVFTSRGSWALYGNTARRVLPTTPKERLAQKLYVFPDKSICDRFAGPEACQHWFYYLADQLGSAKWTELYNKNPSAQQIDKELMRLSFQLMVTHPIQTINGMFWEGAKLLFWELPLWGMVVLPKEVGTVYQSQLVYNVLIVGVNLLNFIFFCSAFSYAIVKLMQFKSTFKENLKPSEVYLFGSLVLIFLYIFFHSFFFLNERNALPIIPLYFVLAGTVIKTFDKK